MASRAALELILQLQGDKKATAGLKTFQSTLLGVSNAASTVKNILSTTVGTFLGFAGLQVGIRGISNAIEWVKDGVTGLNATLETTELQFATLMGSADKATEHVADLFDFAKETPFETEPIIEASRYLETYGSAALNTEENLNLIGDAAAGTSNEIKDLGYWSGRLYSQLDAGRPFGEAAQRLQELAVLSPQARIQMEALQAAGASADEIWNAFSNDLDRFSGSMSRQANTWEGMVSTITDSIDILKSKALVPLFDLAKRGAKTLVGLLDSEAAEKGAQGIANALQNVIDNALVTARNWGNRLADMAVSTSSALGTIAGYMSVFGKYAVDWGVGITKALAAGIELAINSVGLALKVLGSYIQYWLKPGSPPKLLPDLDKWGTGAAEAYLEGWTGVDFSALDQFGTYAKNAIQSAMGDAASPDSLVAVQQAFANVLNQAQGGAVSGSLYDQIATGAGAAGLQLVELARRYAAVTTATTRLAGIQEKLTAAQTNKTAFDEQLRMAELQEILADPRATKAQKERAKLEQEQIALLAEERDAQAEVDTAQSDLDAYQSRLDVALDAVQTMQETWGDVASSISKAASELASVASDTDSESVTLSLDTELDVEAFDLSELWAKLDTANTNFKSSFDDARQSAQDFIDVLPKAEDVIGPVNDIVGDLVDELADLNTNYEEVERHVEAVLGWFERFDKPTQRFKGNVSDLYGAFVDLLDSLGLTEESLAAIDGLTLLLHTDILITSEDIGKIVSFFADWYDKASELTTPLGLVTTAIEGISGGINNITTAMENLRDKSRNWPDWLQKIWQFIDIGWDNWEASSSRLASGTTYYQGGVTLVGEHGPELVSFPTGSRVYPAGQTSMALAEAGSGGSITVHINNPVVSNDVDIRTLAFEVAKEIRRRSR